MTSISLFAKGSIEGYVSDLQTGDALPGANVIFKGTSIGGTTDENGKYRIPNVSDGSYTLRVSYIGYETQELVIEIKDGLTTKVDFELDAVGFESQTVVITAQASGQKEAINQQLSSDQIKNVVSSARIQELPDANAAESVGRLPGISLVREGGEGSQIVVRGLSPEYNQITINGVQIPGNVLSSGRSVDLSMISSSMLGGIEVIKSNTPDMDAAVLGGTVNFTMRKATQTEEGYRFNVLAQDGYNDLDNTFSDYKFIGSGETRFFDSKFGIFTEVNIERRNLLSNELGATYSLNAPVLGEDNPTYLDALNLSYIGRDRHRYGATIVLDYEDEGVKVGLMNFLSSSDTKSQIRSEAYGLTANTHSYTTTDQPGELNVITNLLDASKEFEYFTIDAKLSHSYSENSISDAVSFSFSQSSVGITNANYRYLDPQKIPALSEDDPSKTYLTYASNYSSLAKDRDLSGSLDFTSNILNFSKNISATFKLGGSYKYKYKSYNHDQAGGSMTVGGGNVVRQAILDVFPWMKETVASGAFLMPITVFEDSGFDYGEFLEGDYSMGTPINIGLMKDVMEIIKQNPTEQSYTYQKYQSITNDYTGNEYVSAAYIMPILKIGQSFTMIPGVRFQQLKTSYTAPRGIQSGVDPTYYAYQDTTIDRTNGFWLPMVQVRYKPISWVQLHLAYTHTLNYPAVEAIVPKINVGDNSVAWNNSGLKPAHSTNYDIALSVYNNEIGLFTINGFYKRIEDLIFSVDRYIIDPEDYPGVSDISDITTGYSISTYINNPYKVDLWGIELDWQTHFWYLPGPLSGLVFNINYTHTYSEAKYPRTSVNVVYFPTYEKTIEESYYENRLINQPKDILNMAIGFDYKGFSSRISMLLQSDVFKGESYWPELRVITDDYVRWDFSAKQDLPWFGIQAFFDLNNINSARDVDINQGSNFPEAEEHYGLTANLGIRLSL
jgi:TonB-dependent receptor